VTGSDTDWTSSAGMTAAGWTTSAGTTAAGWTGSDTVSAEVAACLLDFLGVEVLEMPFTNNTFTSDV